MEKHPSILDFALSSDVLDPIAHYLGCVPALYSYLPGGVRFAESSIEYDEDPERFKDSQLYHIDYFSTPNVYMIVLLCDVTPEHGPFTFVGEARSRAAAAKLRYWCRGRPYRVPDEEILPLLPPEEVTPMTFPRGTVLFLDSSKCLHFGSRQCVKTRYMLMYAY